MNTKYATTPTERGSSTGNCTLRYEPIANAMAGGAKMNSIKVANPAMKPPIGPKALWLYANGPPACGMAVVSSVKLKMKVVYIAAIKTAVMIPR